MNDILVYSLKKCAIGLVMIISVSVLLFFLMHLLPGDPIDYMIPKDAIVSDSIKDAMRAKWGLDKPLVVQYVVWAGKILQGDFGKSILYNQPVIHLILIKLPTTLKLAFSSMLIVALITIPLGLLSAFKHGKFFDKFFLSLTTITSSIPSFWLALLLVIAFAISIPSMFPALKGIMPPISGIEAGFRSFILPVATNVICGMAGLYRFTRSEVLENMKEKYVLTAYAKGLSETKVLYKHILRNSMITVVVMFFLGLPTMISGSVIIERIFALPGTGDFIFSSISSNDYPAVMGVVLIVSVLTVICNTAADIVTALLDPRIRIELKGAIK